MDDLTRRGVLHRTAGLGLVAALATGANADEDDRKDKEKGNDRVPNEERDRVRAIGMTEGEIDCWMFAAETAGTFFALPELHPMDKQEVASAIHIIQNKLLSRPTYRRYLEAAKAQAAKAKAAEKK